MNAYTNERFAPELLPHQHELFLVHETDGLTDVIGSERLGAGMAALGQFVDFRHGGTREQTLQGHR